MRREDPWGGLQGFPPPRGKEADHTGWKRSAAWSTGEDGRKAVGQGELQRDGPDEGVEQGVVDGEEGGPAKAVAEEACPAQQQPACWNGVSVGALLVRYHITDHLERPIVGRVFYLRLSN